MKVNVDIPCDDRSDGETSALGEIIHDEIARLPESFRGPLVLCCLEGLSYDLAARRLGLKEPTLRGRLHRARKQLESRLSKRGITTGIFASASETVRLNVSPLPSSLVESTVQFSIRWSSMTGLLPAAVIPAAITGLAEGVARTMVLQTLKLSGVAVLIAAGALGTVVLAQQNTNGPGVGGSATTAQSTPKASSDQDLRVQVERVLKDHPLRAQVEGTLIQALSQTRKFATRSSSS